MTSDRRTTVELAEDESITVTNEDGLYVAEDSKTGISSQGKTEEAALSNLATALETYYEGKDERDDWL
ncbi:hypothetical protein OB905_07340 [Halobacteria archaeon AArc-dxtr1]|nr:hypothetical protein [Halobacteria archaeon AArc-dxtr1]